MCECHQHIDTSFLSYILSWASPYPLTVGVESCWTWSLLTSRTHSLGLPWTRDQPDAELYLTTHNLHKRRDIHASGGIRNHNPSKRVAAYLRLWLRGQRDRPCGYMGIYRSVLLHAAIWNLNLTVYDIHQWRCLLLHLITRVSLDCINFSAS